MKRNTLLTLGLILIAIAFFSYLTYTLVTPTLFASKDSVGFRVTVVHQDGSVWIGDSRDFKPATLILTSTGKPVSYVQIELYIVPSFQGQIVDYSVAGALYMLIKKDSLALYNSGAVSLQQQFKPTLENGKAACITSATLTAASLEGLYSGWQDGQTYSFVYGCSSFMLTAKFADGTTDVKSASNLPAELVLTFKYQKAGAASFISDVQVVFNYNV